jgi:hypothetical protein
MTENTTNKGEADTSSGAALIAVEAPDEQAVVPDDLTDLDEDFTDLDDDLDGAGEDLAEADRDGSSGRGVWGAGALSGGFSFAGLALAVVSLTTNWTSNVVISHGQYSEEMNAPSSGLTVQQELNMYASAWHTQGLWALGFAAAAVLFGAGALLVPWIRHRGAIPGWVKAAATGAIIVGLVGVLLAVLTVVGVLGGHLTAPATSG